MRRMIPWFAMVGQTFLSAAFALVAAAMVGQTFLSAAFAQDVKPCVISSFEPGGPSLAKGGAVVAEHATDGENACRVESTPEGYPGITIDDAGTLAKFPDYVVLKADVYNPQDRVVQFGVRVDDAKSNSYGSRYNDDGVAVRPGKSTFELNLTTLTRSSARSFMDREKLDLAKLKVVMFFMHPSKDKYALYFDNIRLEGSGMPAVEGLRAFDFGPAGSAVYPGFEDASDKRTFAPGGFGWVGAQGGRRLNSPDDLGCDFVRGGEFRVALPNGSYEVNVHIDAVGEWHTPYFWRRRALTLNGKEALRETQDAKTFFDKVYLRHENEEDLPGLDVWEKFVVPVNTIRRFPVEVTDGTLRVALTADNWMGQTMTFLVVYPSAKQAEGRRWMDALDKVRRERFNNAIAVGVPPAPANVLKPRPVDQAQGFITFARHTEDDIPATYIPSGAEITKGVTIQAAQGEREHVQFGVYPLVARPAKMNISVSDLRGPNGAVIPASAMRLRYVRNFLKRMGGSTEGRILPYILQDFDTLDLKPGVARGVWLTVQVPDDARPGMYAGRLTFGLAGQAVKDSKVLTLDVFPFKLDPAKSTTLSVTGTSAGHWRGTFPELEDEWWRLADVVMKDLADHGLNAVTGGPGATLRGIRDGKADIDYADMDRWLALAVTHGLTMPGDSYQGLAINGVPHNQGPNCLKIVEDDSQRRFGLPYKDVIRIVYGAAEQHAKEKGWPKRAYYLLDEPRSNYGNVQSCLDLIKIVTAAAPNTLFSGYYSEGDGRDPYFQIMPVSIAHVTENTLKLTKDAAKQLWCYDGNRARHNIGRWAFAMSKKGLKGYLRNGYLYVNSDPYFDFTEDEGSWCTVYPSRKGFNATVGWERTGQGANDFRYLEMLDALSAEARATNKAAVISEGCRGCKLVEKVTDAAKVGDTGSVRVPGEDYDAFKREAAELIVSLRKMLEKK